MDLLHLLMALAGVDPFPARDYRGGNNCEGSGLMGHGSGGANGMVGSAGGMAGDGLEECLR